MQSVVIPCSCCLLYIWGFSCSKCSKAKTPDAKQTPEQQEQRIKVLQGQLSSPVWALSIFWPKNVVLFWRDNGKGGFCVRSWQRGQILCQILATRTDFVSDPGNGDRFCVRSWQRGQILCQILATRTDFVSDPDGIRLKHDNVRMSAAFFLFFALDSNDKDRFCIKS